LSSYTNRVLHVAQFVHRYPPALGGAEAYIARLSEYLVARGDAVTVWTTTAIELNELWNGSESGGTACPWSMAEQGHAVPPLSKGVEVYRYRPITFPLRRYILKALSLVPNRPWQAAFQPVNPICPRMWKDAGTYDGRPLDAVHATAFPYAFPILCARRLAKRRKVPFLLTPFLHLGDPTDPRDRTRRQYTKPHLRWLLNEADTVFVQTPSERDAVVGFGVPPSRVVLQGLGVDASECTGGNRSKVREAWGVGLNEVVVGHLANNSVEKGTVDLLMTSSALIQRVGNTKAIDDMNYRIVLAGNEMANFSEAWKRHPFKARVLRLGVLSDEQKRDFFAGIDIFALPSRTDSFGLVLLEAWANGKPVVAYRAGGPADLVRHGVDGLLAKCDVNDLCKQLRTLIENEELRTRMGEAGRERVGVEFRWEDKLKLFRDRLESPPTVSGG